MNCIIIDDEETARIIIEKLAENNSKIDLKAQFPNAIEAIKFLNQNSVDLIFLDIHMPDFTGFDFIQTIKNPPKIILTSSDPNFAIEAFEYESIVDYLIKPITQERFDKAVNKALLFKPRTGTAMESSIDKPPDDDLYVNIDRRLIKINIEKISIIEARGDYIYITAEEKNYMVHTTMKKIEDKLPNDIFLKVHRSFIINIRKIIDIEDNSILIGKNIIPVSRANRPELMKRLNLL